MANQWIKSNYRKLVFITVGTTAAVSVAYYAYNSLFSGSKKVDRNDLVKYMAKRITLKSKELGHEDILSLCNAVRQACQPELAQLEKEYKDKREKLELDFTIRESIDSYNKFVQDQERIIEDTKSRLMAEIGVDQEQLEARLREIKSESILNEFSRQGHSVPAILADKTYFSEILKEFLEHHDKLREENPDLEPQLLRRASSKHIFEKHNISTHEFEAAIDIHHSDDEVQHYINQYESLKQDQEDIRPSLIRAFSAGNA